MNKLDYYKEVGFEVIDSEKGWANYKIMDKECYVDNVYIYQEYRGTYLPELVNQIIQEAKKNGCEFLSATTQVGRGNTERTARAIIKLGGKVHSSHNNIITWVMEI